MSVMIAFAAAIAAQAAAPPPPAQPKACVAAAHSEFDFWVGEWDVFPAGKDVSTASSRIEKLYEGCAIRENWMPMRGGGGGSLNRFEPTDGRWHQVWMDSAGARVDFDGGRVGETMVLIGWWRNIAGPGKHALVRMTYTPNGDGSVRQHGEQSIDHGRSWQTAFDLTYRRKPAASPAR